ncbi:MAG: hypothetical protein KDB61_00680, partial [Planctomycetes bacterium]|nr:hypothetical protein [Planctomycetota bacterium]
AKLEKLVADEPNDTAFHAELASVLMLRGDLPAAKSRIDVGLGISPNDADLLDLRSQLAKASQGPSWRKSQREEGVHFVVETDLDKRAVRVIARVADEAMGQYEQVFGVPSDSQGKLPLFLFAGESSYKAYIQGVADANAESTLGIFSPLLKQVLVWNQSDRQGLIRVVRHEVMHAYMDRVLGFSPPWLAEGLSEFCAESKDEEGQWQAGGICVDHLRVFETYGLQKLSVDQLLHMPQEHFMANSNYTYPMAWAFVHFLLTTSPGNRAHFDAIWGRLKGRIGPMAATREVFQSVDMAALDKAFWEHVIALIQQHR